VLAVLNRKKSINSPGLQTNLEMFWVLLGMEFEDGKYYIGQGSLMPPVLSVPLHGFLRAVPLAPFNVLFEPCS
jgi:hypothetical protein